MAATTSDAVRLIFEAIGIDVIDKAIGGLESRMLKFEKVTARSGRARVQSEEGAAKGIAAAAGKGEKERARAEASVTRQLEAAAKAQARIRDNSAKYAGRVAAQQANEEIRETERSGKARAAAEEKWAKQRARIQDKAATDAGKYAAREAAAEARAMSQAREAKAARGRHIGGVVSGSIGRAAGVATSVLAGAAAIGGGISLWGAMDGELRAEKEATALSNASFIPVASGGTGERLDSQEMLRQSKAIQAETNIGKSDVLAAEHSYIDLSSDTSIFKKDDRTGRTQAQDLARIAKASGSDIGEVFGMAGNLRANNADLTGDEMMKTMLAVYGQAKLGKVSAKEMVSIAPTVVASASMYAGDQTENQRGLLGLAQLAARASGSADIGATAVTDLSNDLLKHKSKLSELGVHGAFDAHGRIADRGDLMGQVFDKTKGDPAKLLEVFGLRSIKIPEALTPIFDAAEKVKKGSGGAAVAAEVHKFEKATYSKGDVDTDFDKVMADKAERISAAMLRLQEVLAEKGIPILEKWIDKMPELMPQLEKVIDGASQLADAFSPDGSMGGVISGLASLAGWMGEHPFQAIGALMMKDATEHLIGVGLEKAIGALVVTPFGQVAAAAGAMAIAIEAGIAVINATLKDTQVRGQVAPDEEARKVDNIRRKLQAGGTLTGDDQAEIEKAKNLKTHLDGIDLDPDKAKTLGEKTALMTRILAHPKDALEKFGSMETGGMDRLTTALEGFATAAGKIAPASGSGPLASNSPTVTDPLPPVPDRACRPADDPGVSQ